MAKIIATNTESQAVRSSYSWWKVALIGVILGVIYYYLTLVLNHYVISPVACRSVLNASACLNSDGMSGDMATILVAAIGIVIMLCFHMTRPLIVAVASGVALWGLARWTDGLSWVEIIAWSALLYGLAYSLFSWLARYVKIVPVLIAMTVIVITMRVIVTL
jgi:hypothetical protein